MKNLYEENLEKWFSHWLITTRKLKGVSRYELSKRTGISYEYLSQLERGERRKISLELMNRLLIALDTEMLLPIGGRESIKK